jgi:hypothetical protein
MPKLSTGNVLTIISILIVGIGMGLGAAAAYGSLSTRVSHIEKQTEGLAPTVVELRIAVAELTQAINSHVAADKVTE